jgi:prepilin-type N-terminal cleavage/methylation domain-containing protein/prepilin-type processing-associated H-X9-DG protein
MFKRGGIEVESMRRKSLHARCAFTLVELLVVIGIIAILIGILLPVIGKARRSSTLVACRANLSQIANALRMYANDNHDHYPDGYTLGGAVFRLGLGVRTPVAIDPFSKPERYGMTAALHGIDEKDDLSRGVPTHYRYLPGQSQVWVCPAQSEDRRAWGNTYVNVIAAPGTTLASYTSLKRGRANKVFWVYDNFGNLPFTSGARKGGADGGAVEAESKWIFPHDLRVKNARIADGKRIQGSINIMFLDGHVGSAVYRYKMNSAGVMAIGSEILDE